MCLAKLSGLQEAMEYLRVMICSRYEASPSRHPQVSMAKGRSAKPAVAAGSQCLRSFSLAAKATRDPGQRQ